MDPLKKQARKDKNRLAKQKKAEAKKLALAAIGKLVEFKTRTVSGADGKDYVESYPVLPEFIATAKDGSILPFRNHSGPSVSRSAFVGAKTYKQHGLSMKNRPGNKELHTEAIVENASRAFTAEVDKALAPAEETPIPVIPQDLAEQGVAL